MNASINPTTGNILEADVEALVNTVNTIGVMGKGIALQFRRAYPTMYQAYRTACEAEEIHIGQMHVFERNEMFNPRFIINFPTKRHWRDKSYLEDIQAGLQDLVQVIKRYDIRSIAVPPLGCGNGGLDWMDVKPIIFEAFSNLPEVQVQLYEPIAAIKLAGSSISNQRKPLTMARALLITVLKEYPVLGYESTMLDAEKLMYFLQEAGEPLKLRYEQGHFGPYADNLRHLIEPLEGSYIEGYGAGNNKPDTTLRLLPGAAEAAEDYIRTHANEKTLGRLRRLQTLIEGFESHYGLELLATLHWTIVHEKKEANFDVAVSFIHKWNTRKRKLMQINHLQIAWQHLTQAGWIFSH